MGAAARRQQHKAELRADILAAARSLFARQGYEGFTMRRLAEAIGYSPASIYLYFKDKNEIFDFLVEESFATLLAALPQPSGAPDENPVALLKRSLRLYVDFGLTHPDDYRFAFLLAPGTRPRPYKQRTAYESLRAKVALCVGEKLFRATDVDCTAQALWAAAHGITSLLIQRPNFPWAAREKLIGQVLDSAVDSLLAAPPQRARPRRRPAP